MPDVYEGQERERPDIQRFAGIVRRRYLSFVIPLFIGWLLVWGFSWVLSPRYKSSTLILVEQPTMSQNYVVPNINDDLQTRLQTMTEQILSRSRLLVIINKLHLYGATQGTLADDQKVAGMRKDIGIDLVRNPGRTDISSFTISYSAADPHLAQQVTAALTGLFIGENLKMRQQESEGTTDFLEKQLEDARQTLSEQEAKVRQFESEHGGALPAQEQGNIQILAGLQSQLQSDQDALNTARQQRVYLQALLEQERKAQASLTGTDQAGVSAPTDLATINQQLDTLRAELAGLSSKYTDRYPDVQRLKDQIARTEREKQNLIAAAKSRSTGATQQSDDTTLSAAGRQLLGQLDANQLEIANRESSVESLKSRVNEYQGRLNLLPATEQGLAELTRGYDQSKANYDDLLKKKEGSEMATSMEEMQQGERFTTLDPPNLPPAPYYPNRLVFCGIGLGVGLALGLLFAGGLEFLDDRLYSGKEIKALLPMAVLSDIPEIVSSWDKARSKRKLALGWTMTALVVVLIAAGSAFSYLHH